MGALFVVLSTIFSIYQGVIVRNATNEIVNLIANHKSVDSSKFIVFGLTLLGLALTSGFFFVFNAPNHYCDESPYRV
jgi:uncharacterized membrane protein YqhA